MKKTLEENLNLKSTEVNIDSNRYNKILDEIIFELNDNKQEIKRVNDIDKSLFNTDIDIQKLISIIENLKNKQLITNTNSKNILISYYGDPYITLELCIQAIKTNNKLILSIEDYMLGVNKVLVNIITTVLKDYKIENKLFLYNLLNKEEIIYNELLIDKIICVGNKNTFEVYKRLGLSNLLYYPYNNIDLYCDTDELEELQKMIYNYAENNNIDLEIYDEFKDIENGIDFINRYGSGFCSILLTKSKENEKKFKNNINSDYVFVNENPFNKYEFCIDKYI